MRLLRNNEITDEAFQGAAKFDEADARIISILDEVEEALTRARWAILNRRKS